MVFRNPEETRPEEHVAKSILRAGCPPQAQREMIARCIIMVPFGELCRFPRPVYHILPDDQRCSSKYAGYRGWWCAAKTLQEEDETPSELRSGKPICG
jgi:hypothetical protein